VYSAEKELPPIEEFAHAPGGLIRLGEGLRRDFFLQQPQS